MPGQGCAGGLLRCSPERGACQLECLGASFIFGQGVAAVAESRGAWRGRRTLGEMPGDRDRGWVFARVLGGAGAVAGCVPMVAMVPSAVSSAFALVGLGAGSGAVAALSPALSPVAQPLLLAATALVAVSHLRCGRLAVASAAAGGALLYLGMYVFTGPHGGALAVLFYPGLALFLGSYLIPVVRRRRGRCRPVLSLRRARVLLGATLISSAIAVASVTAFGSGAAGASGGRGHGGAHAAPGAVPGMSMSH